MTQNNSAEVIKAATGTKCPACERGDIQVFFDMTGVPVNSCLMVNSKEEALNFPTDNLRLGFCRSCGFISNLVFDVEMITYSASYEETQGCSPRFNAFARDLAQRLIDRYDIHGQHLLEIGCGKGEFLALMCELGGNTGTGIDPSYVPGRLSAEAESRIDFITDFYSEKYSDLKGDVVVCRHTLEHIAPVRDFMQMVRSSIGDRPEVLVFFEVPDVLRVLRETAFWDIYYEHCSYFSLGSLGRLFRSCGFEILDLHADFDDQYLLIEARPAQGPVPTPHPAEDDMQPLEDEVAYFARSIQDKFGGLKSDLAQIVKAGKKAVVWGSGSKAVAYLTGLKITEEIEYVVDINPMKHGKFLAGTGHEIVAPEFLIDYKPDEVILMNPIYLDEVQRDLTRMGLSAKLLAV
jgi:SAM-dependent methyltransferase